MERRLKTICLLFIVISSLGCAGQVSNETTPAPAPQVTPQMTPELPTQNEDESIQKLELRIHELEKNVSELEEAGKFNGLMKQSTKNLIPNPPFPSQHTFQKELELFIQRKW